MRDFGVIVVCCAMDVHLARGCCASIRHFLGDTPICLLVDGHVDVSDISSIYNTAVIRNVDLSEQRLREVCCGWGYTKMAAHWVSPFATFLLLDADTAIWGDVRRHADFENFDIVVDRHMADLFPGHMSRAVAPIFGAEAVLKSQLRRLHVKKWYFDVSRMDETIPAVHWENAIEELFCSAVTFARRGSFDLQRFYDLLDRGDADPDLFAAGEMGIYNAMVIESGLRTDHRTGLHQFVQMDSRSNLMRRFTVDAETGPIVGEEATVLHWAGETRPTLDGRLAYSDPMTFFRRKFYQDRGINEPKHVDKILRNEDLMYRDLRPIPAFAANG